MQSMGKVGRREHIGREVRERKKGESEGSYRKSKAAGLLSEATIPEEECH